MFSTCLRNYFPYALMGFIDSLFFLLVQDKFSSFMVRRLSVPDLSATLISGTLSGSFSFFIGLVVYEKSRDKTNEALWYHKWLAMTTGNVVVCVLSFFVA